MCVVVNFAAVPRVNMGSLSWLVTVIWVVAYLWWVVVAWAVVEVVRARVSQKALVRGRPSRSVVFGLLVGVFGVSILVGVWKLPSQSSVNPVSAEESTQVSHVVRTVANAFPPGAVAVKFWPTPIASPFSPEDYVEYQYGQAILWQLTTAGFAPSMQPFFTDLSGVISQRNSSARVLDVIMTKQGWTSVIKRVVVGSTRAPAGHRLS